MEGVPFIAAFTAGVVSFLSPCVLPLVPGYISLLSGVPREELIAGDDAAVLRKVLLHSVFFIMGFSIVFIGLGASASWLFRCRPFLQALHVVDAVTVLHPVGIVAESREPTVPARQGAEVAQVRAVVGSGRLAGHQHRDAWRIRNHAGGEHPVSQLFERHVFDLIAD